MRYGISVPNFGVPADLVQLGHATERAGWDGFFLWDHVLVDADHPFPINDPWVVLGAIAQTTERVRLGTLVTPVARRRPWKLARETVTLDHLSGGRAVLGVGLGEPPDVEFGAFGEPTDDRVRAERLDEGLEVLFGLWSGARFSFEGRHLTVDGATFLPRPVQSPRIPVWVVGAWPKTRSLQRVLRWDGLLPDKINEDGSHGKVTPEDISAMKAYIDENRPPGAPFDIVMEGETPGNDPRQAATIVRPFAQAGATWWHESRWSSLSDPGPVRERIRQGPPRLDDGR